MHGGVKLSCRDWTYCLYQITALSKTAFRKHSSNGIAPSETLTLVFIVKPLSYYLSQNHRSNYRLFAFPATWFYNVLPLTVVSFPSFVALLFVTKYQINPIMDIVGHIGTLERFTTFSYEIFRAYEMQQRVISCPTLTE